MRSSNETDDNEIESDREGDHADTEASATRAALRASLYYLAFGVAWIVVTDALLPVFVQDVGPWQTYKGIVFVLASAAVIHLLVGRELAERRRAEERRRASERRYQLMFERSVAGFFRSTVDGLILDCNRELASMLGFDDAEDLIGTDARSLYAEEEQREAWIEALDAGGEIRNFELHLHHRDGSSVWTLMNATLLEEDPDGPVLAGTMVDVTREKRLRDELEAYAYHDTLTGLPNRRHLRVQAESVFSKARRDGTTVGLLYLDLNRFKRINDTLGHEVGDDVLFQFGRRLLHHLREEDVAARIGGDEFAVLLNTVKDRQGAVEAAERLYDALSEPFFAGDRSLHVSPSVGVAVHPEHADSFAALLSCADQAMYRASEKESGVAVYEPSTTYVRRDQIAEEEDLREALRRGQLELHYQPIFRVDDGRLVGAEALARWRHPELGLRPPGVFIPVAEHSGLIRELDLWAFETVVEDARSLASNGSAPWLSVNVSAQSLRHDDVLRRFKERLERSRLDPGQFVIEVTESTAMQDPRAAVAVFEALQERGARIAIDDFGTGHSALAYLKVLPCDLVKLDLIFIRGIETSAREDRLLKALVGLGRSLGVDVVAEGVETEGQHDRLAAHDCDLAQGFHLGRPMQLERLRGLL